MRRPATWLAAIAVMHFAVSGVEWTMVMAFAVRHEWLAADWWRFIVVPAVSWCILLPASITCVVLAIRQSSRTRVAVAALYIAIVALFAFDVANERWQIHTFIADQSRWDAGGREHTYCTWWWYNDLWFR